jgi:hypothetical protein
MTAGARKKPPVRTSELVSLADLARSAGLSEESLAKALASKGLVGSKRTADAFFRTTVLGAFSARELKSLRQLDHDERMRTRTSKRWVAGYPELVAEWHPTKNGDLYPDQVSFGSHARIWWKCPRGPDHEWVARPNHRTSGKGCPFCCGLRVSITNSVATCEPQFAKEWHPTKNGKLRPEDVTAGSHKEVWWQCPARADHVWRTTLVNRFGCPYCYGTKPTPDRTLASSFPALVAEWHPTKNSGPHTPGTIHETSRRLVWWRCSSDPDHEWRAAVFRRTERDQGCPFCTGKVASSTNSLAALHPEIAAQWHPTKNAPLTAADVLPHARRLCWWKCPLGPDHEWRVSINNRVTGETACPFCLNRRVSKTNSLAALHPRLAKEWHPSKNAPLTPKDIVATTKKSYWWQCYFHARHVWLAPVSNRTILGSGCPMCD